MKIGVYGNCQASGIAESITALCTGAIIHLYRVNEAMQADAAELAAQVAAFSACDVIFTQPNRKMHVEPFSPQGLAAMCSCVIPYPQIAFRGMQPDCHQISHGGRSVQGPLGPYHSRIVAACVLLGLSETRTVALFNRYIYTNLGYLNRSHAEDPLVRDAAEFGYDFRDFVAGERGRFMHTVNHPAIAIVHACAQQALKKAGLDANDAPAPEDRLARGWIWPVYLEIGHAFGIREDLRFVARQRSFTLEAFVDESFRLYAPQREALADREILETRITIAREVR